MPLMKHKSEQITLKKQESEEKDYKIGGGIPMPVGDKEEVVL